MNEAIYLPLCNQMVVGIVFSLCSAFGSEVAVVSLRWRESGSQEPLAVVANSALKTALWNLAVHQLFSVARLTARPLCSIGEVAHPVTLAA